MSIVKKEERESLEPSCEGINLTDSEIDSREAEWIAWYGKVPTTQHDLQTMEDWIIGLSDDGPD